MHRLTAQAANALLAQRISSINAISAICEATGANVYEVADACGVDRRIGPHFLRASVGFGGSCFQKDILNLVYLSGSLGLPEVAEYWRQVIVMNEFSKARFAKKVVQTLFNTVTAKRLALLGFAFKKDTGDTVRGPTNAARVASHHAVQALPPGGCAHCDLRPQGEARANLPRPHRAGGHGRPQGRYVRAPCSRAVEEAVTVCPSVLDACHDAEAVVIATDWDEFSAIDWYKVFNIMRKPAVVFDGRRVVDPAKLREIGFRVHAVGVGPEMQDNVWV